MTLSLVVGPFNVAAQDDEPPENPSGEGWNGPPPEDHEPTNYTETHVAPADDPPGWDVAPSTVPGQLPGSTSLFQIEPASEELVAAGLEIVSSPVSGVSVQSQSGGGSGSDHGGHLGNAPEALTEVLEKFLARGQMPPENFPVPYEITTISGATTLVTDALTHAPVMINVDGSSATGQGAKDIRVKTTISSNPLTITTSVERLGLVTPPDLKVYVTFPAYFYTGEADDPDGKPFWSFGYETQPGHAIPPLIEMTFTVDQTPGSEHTYDFTWTGIPASPLGFVMGVFQALDGDPTTPVLPAFSNFVADPMPTSASVTFDTVETATSTQKCFHWASPQPFLLSFGYSEAEVIGGVDTSYDMDATVDQMPADLVICTTEDRAAHTYGFDYVASAPVDLVDIHTEIVPAGAPTVTIDLGMENVPSDIHALLGDGFLDVDVGSDIGLVRLDAVADFGLGEIPALATLRLRLADVPDLHLSWFAEDSANGVGLTAPDCLGAMEFAFSYGGLLFPPEHAGDPDSHYLFAHSDPALTTIAARLLDVTEIAFTQHNDDSGNEVDLGTCARHVLYVLAHTEVGSLLSPGHDLDLRIVMDEAPTLLGVDWTVPFALGLQTNEPIASIVGDLTYDDLVAHAELLDLPGAMGWTVDPGGSIDFDAAAPIGSVLLQAHDPVALPGGSSFAGGENLRLLELRASSVPGFAADWSSDDAVPSTAVAFLTDPGTSVDLLRLALSSAETGFLTVGGVEDNRGLLYHDDTEPLSDGSGLVFSMWMRLDDLHRASFETTGSPSPTYAIGYGAAVPHELRLVSRLDGASDLNPAAPDVLEGTVTMSDLPTAVDLSITPRTGFTYTASAAIAEITADLTLGTGTPTTIHGELHDLPTTASGDWAFGGAGHANVLLGGRLGSLELTADDAGGLFGGAFTHVEASLTDVPESLSSSWDTAARSATLSFLDGSYDEGLGELRALATTGSIADTEAYVNGLGAASSCMTTYTDYTRTIDARYWPSTVPGRLDALYCRQPTLDSGLDDYVFSRSGNDGGADFRALGLRLRELGSLGATVGPVAGSADVQFSRNVALARAFIVLVDDYDGDDRTAVEASRLPDGLATNSLHAEYDRSVNHFGYALSEVVPFVDVYSGAHDAASFDTDFTKVVFQDVPASVDVDFNFLEREGFFDVVASSPWEMGFLSQEDGKRTAGWLQMQSLAFDYSFALPGEEDCDHGFDVEFCYRVLRLELSLDALPIDADGMLGTYVLKTTPQGLSDEDGAEPAPGAREFIPEWAFLLNDFDLFAVDVLWDAFAGFDVDPPDAGAGFLPSIAVVTDFHLFVDYFWNDRIEETLVSVFIPLIPPPCSVTDGIIVLNPVPDYVNQRPLHLFPFDGDDPVSFDFSFVETDSPSDPFDCWNYDATLTVDVPGFHRRSDHQTPF